MKAHISILLACTLKIWCAAATDPYTDLDRAIALRNSEHVRSALDTLRTVNPPNLKTTIDARIFILTPRGYTPSWSDAAYNKIIDAIHYPFGVEVARISKRADDPEMREIIHQLEEFRGSLLRRRK